MSDIEIARAAKNNPIQEIGAKPGMPSEDLPTFGHDKAKVSEKFIKSLAGEKDGHLILVTAINPTDAGEGKTTTTVGLGDGLNAVGKKAAICIREASLDPNFGMKGAAAGGGFAQIVPMADKMIRDQLKTWKAQDYGNLPVCMAKTQYSFTTDPNRRGAPTGHSLPVREVRLAAGAGFVVAICGEIMTMPSPPRKPVAETICINDAGEIDGLF